MHSSTRSSWCYHNRSFKKNLSVCDFGSFLIVDPSKNYFMHWNVQKKPKKNSLIILINICELWRTLLMSFKIIYHITEGNWCCLVGLCGLDGQQQQGGAAFNLPRQKTSRRSPKLRINCCLKWKSSLPASIRMHPMFTWVCIISP